MHILDERCMGCLIKIQNNFLRKAIESNWYQNLDYKLIRECVKLKINISYILVEAKRLWDHSKSFHLKLLIFDPLLHLFIPVHFTCAPSPSTYVRFSELPPPSQKKFQDTYEFSNEKFGNEKRDRNFFYFKLNV